MSWSNIVETTADIASIVALIAAGCWFIYTSQFKQRLQFDLDCRFVPLAQNPQSLLAELQFIFENKGFVEHRLWNLTVSVHALITESQLNVRPGDNEVVFQTRILPEKQLVPQKYGYYFVRPGVRQAITHIVEIPADVSVMRVTSSFNYNRDKSYPHTARRIFPVPKR